MATKKPQQEAKAVGLCAPPPAQLVPGIFEPRPPVEPFAPEELENRVRRSRNLFSYNNFRVKSSDQRDRGDFWEYVVVLESYQSEIVLRQAVSKGWTQPNLPQVGEKYVFDLFAEDKKICVGEIYGERSTPTLKPYRAED